MPARISPGRAFLPHFGILQKLQKTDLDADRKIPYSRRLKSQTNTSHRRWALPERRINDPRGWARTGNVACVIPAGREASVRPHGSRRRASDIAREAPASNRRLDRRRESTGSDVSECRCRNASNRSRKSSLSFAPLGHELSGGLFFAPAALKGTGPCFRPTPFPQNTSSRRKIDQSPADPFCARSLPRRLPVRQPVPRDRCDCRRGIVRILVSCRSGTAILAVFLHGLEARATESVTVPPSRSEVALAAHRATVANRR